MGKEEEFAIKIEQNQSAEFSSHNESPGHEVIFRQYSCIQPQVPIHTREIVPETKRVLRSTSGNESRAPANMRTDLRIEDELGLPRDYQPITTRPPANACSPYSCCNFARMPSQEYCFLNLVCNTNNNASEEGQQVHFARNTQIQL